MCGARADDTSANELVVARIGLVGRAGGLRGRRDRAVFVAGRRRGCDAAFGRRADLVLGPAEPAFDGLEETRHGAGSLLKGILRLRMSTAARAAKHASG